MGIFKLTGRMIFKSAFGLIWNWNLLTILKKNSGICTGKMQNKLMHSARRLILSRGSNPVPLTYEAVVLSIVTPNYTKQTCFKLQLVPTNRSCIVWHVINDAYWDRLFIPRGVHRNNMQVLLTCNIFERSAVKSCRKLVYPQWKSFSFIFVSWGPEKNIWESKEQFCIDRIVSSARLLNLLAPELFFLF